MSPRPLHLLPTLRTPLPFERDRARRLARRDPDADARRSPAMSGARPHAEPAKSSDPRSTPPSPRAMLEEIVPLVGVIPVAGPPAILLAGPWILFALLLAGPVAVLVTMLIALIAAGLLIVAIAAIVASPYLLVRHLRSSWAHHSASHTLAQLLPANPPATADVALLPKSVSAAGS